MDPPTPRPPFVTVGPFQCIQTRCTVGKGGLYNPFYWCVELCVTDYASLLNLPRTVVFKLAAVSVLLIILEVCYTGPSHV